MINLNETITQIKRAGSTNVRAVPMAGQSVNDGLYQIEVLSEGQWNAIVGGITQVSATQIISQAVNRVICG